MLNKMEELSGENRRGWEDGRTRDERRGGG